MVYAKGVCFDAKENEVVHMDFRNYETISRPVQRQIDRVREIWLHHLGADVVGIYIHGSMALHCFVEGVSDIDLLIVTGRRVPRAERLAIAGDILCADARPSPLELSALWQRDLIPWQHPTPCQFHYSEAWSERYRQLLRGELAGSFIVDEDFRDPDIACHAKLTRQCGICIFGKPARDVFPPVPEADFWQSISDGVEDYDFHAYASRYFASNILVLARILSYKVEGRILSKHEAGRWALARVPGAYHPIIEQAMRAWYAGAEMPACDPETLEGLRRYLIGEIRA